MIAADSRLPKELTTEEIASLLRRVLAVVEKSKRNRWVEFTCAVVLSLATTSSAWCAYQSTRWSGVQTFRLAEANKAGRQSSAAVLSSLQLRTFDASMGISWMQANTRATSVRNDFCSIVFAPK